jgi:23S rRNA (guanine745-N1)-methyltransferase
MPSTAPPLACSVRACGLPLERRGASWVCERGHSFDVARSGYVSLLQPQDRRSLEAGDSRATALSRRELLDEGFGAVLESALVEVASELELAPGAFVADLGCGDGRFLAAVCAKTGLHGIGIDLSAHAVELGARRHPAHTWVVANADRRLPLVDGSLALALSIDGRRPRDEFARTLCANGALLVAVPAADDLAELRGAVLGEVHDAPRVERVAAELAPDFVLAGHTTARARIRLERASLARLAAATYRCARAREREALEQLDGLEVTTSHDVLVFRRSHG